MDIDPFDDDDLVGVEAAVECVDDRMLRELNGTIPDAQMVEEIALALAVHRRALNNGTSLVSTIRDTQST